MPVKFSTKFLGLFLVIIYIGVIHVELSSAQKVDRAAMKKQMLAEMKLPATATIKDMCNALAKEEKKATGADAAAMKQIHDIWRVPCKNPKVTFDSFLNHVEKEMKKMVQKMMQAQG